MCGIVGKVNFDPDQPIDPVQIQRMATAVKHRGPDDEGIWTGDGVGLGHRRLSIIDLSVTGHNPMCNEDGSVWIVFNGEIYNFRELRPELEARGHTFRSHTDTEVIVHLYEELGSRCVDKLRGMFAFAIWDRRAQQLLLARDRLGVKPLYYTCDSHRLLFASEIKAILASSELAPKPDNAGIDEFLLWQCISSPRTGFEGVSKLPPASTLTWQRNKRICIQRYWGLSRATVFPKKEAEIVASLRALVCESTQIRLVADVPIGIFLSGGIDSACVLAAARQVNSGKLKTFSIAFEDQTYDESRYARILASHFDTDHHEFTVTARALEALPQVVDLFDEPFGDLASLPTYFLARLSSAHVKVALSGDGGDEAFGGYQRYLALKVLRWLSHLPGHRWLPRLAAFIPYDPQERSRRRYLRELLSLADRQPKQQYLSILLGMLDQSGWRAAYRDEFRETLVGEGAGLVSCWDTAEASDDLGRAMTCDTLSYIPECLNTKVDICSMACGLEVRSPFLDQKLVESCASLPSSLKIRRTEQKYILRKAFRDKLPKDILQRSKAGFGLPIARWLRNELKDYAHSALLARDSPLSTIIKSEHIRRMLSDHESGTRNWHIQLWRLLVLDSWLRAGIQGRNATANSRTNSGILTAQCR